jgi:hypothetical protein
MGGPHDDEIEIANINMMRETVVWLASPCRSQKHELRFNTTAFDAHTV